MSAGDPAMRLGNFSMSLVVKDLAVSRAFYEKLGFASVGGDGKRWSVLRNGATKIGLFQGLFEKNILTFNPGWDADRNTPADFVDVRVLQRTLKARGVKLTTEADENSSGPASFTLTDPDGNDILVDQHVGK
jgi:catechol 2,3-dioxygenase-like lactoylglutathione lyase family enzyme